MNGRCSSHVHRNSHESAATGFTPYFLVTAGHPRLSFDNSLPTTPITDLPEASTALVQRQAETLATARNGLALAQALSTEYANIHRTAKIFAPGDRVYLSTRNLKLQGPSRFHPRWLGPYVVLIKISDVASILDLPPAYADSSHVSCIAAEGGATWVGHISNYRLRNRRSALALATTGFVSAAIFDSPMVFASSSATVRVNL
uniref:Uncharacterized protein n=1 Tax=Rhodosorus marinus TaxID=101924 RepID=A0A7S3EG76_9RHOD|mmetsp:Transcript_33826/g.132892  ORF Transcript_33826/g.132892 Transcript_33826/m.132892 type:complete len:202 (+) Transcript_33826:248-853(+)